MNTINKIIFASALTLLLFSACPNQLMRDLVEQKLASPTADTLLINGGAAGTASQTVTISSKVTKNNDSLDMRFKNETGDWSAWQRYSAAAGWTLTPGDNGSLGATKTVYAEFRDEGHHVVSMQGSIVYCAAVPNGNFFVWGTGTLAGQLHTQINTINSSLYINVTDAVDMRFNNDGGAWSAWMPYSTTAAWPLQAIDGARTVNAEFRNAGGSNVLTPNYTINLDTIAPTFGAPLAINGAAAVSYSPSVSLTFASPDGIWVEFQNDGGAWTAREALASPRAWTLNASAGSRTVGVRITDVAGNQTVGVPASINLVTAAPVPTTVSPTAVLRPTWTWPAFTGAATYRMQMDSTAGAWTVIGNVTSYTPSSDLAVGMHTFYLQAQDSAGNWSTIGNSSVTIDLSAPGAPTLTVPTPTNDNTPTWTWLAVPDTASYLYQLDTTTGTWTEVSSSTLSFTPAASLPDGQHTLFLQAKKNLTGTLSPMASATTRIDTTAPGAPGTPVNAAASDGWINLAERNAGISIAVPLGVSGASAGDILELLLNGSSILSTRTLTAGDISAAQYIFSGVAGSLGADGVKTLTARVTDQVGNVGSLSSALTFILDSIIPSVTLASSHPEVYVKAGDAVTFTASFSEAAAALPFIRLVIGGADNLFSMSATADPRVWTYTWVVPAVNFPVAVSIIATDLAGNVNTAATGATNFIIDSTAPTAPTAAGEDHTLDSTPTWTWSGASDAGGSGLAGYLVRLDAGGWMDVGLVSSYTPVSLVAPGSHIFYVQSYDLAGNISALPGSYPTTIYTSGASYTDSTSIGSSLFGGRADLIDPDDSVGLGQTVNFSTAMNLSLFGFYFTGGFGAEVLLRLVVRDTAGVEQMSLYRFVPAGFSGGWFYWTNFTFAIPAGSTFIFTTYVCNSVGTSYRTGMRAEVSAADYPGNSYFAISSTNDSYFDSWPVWSNQGANWDFWFRAFGD